ncbi:dolichol kinase sec59 [Staphylotrichum tortipilum]|uniref:dolichol kinase n=1 Tax=Staphylotrichum tortipilum TaxID=2831512 RepID=A0AAN6RVA4_9PEZI|nr:dolichol kinase sec59 [Staphylotrichum longicolle]
MTEHLQPSPLPPPATSGPNSADEGHDTHDTLRVLSRSPHPYHRLNSELLAPSDRIAYPHDPSVDDDAQGPTAIPVPLFPSFARESPLGSESGTEADDEHFLKGLPAPKARLHKGLRGRNEILSGTSTPLLSPAVLEEEGRKAQLSSPSSFGRYEHDRRTSAERVRRRREIIRRATEVLLLVCQGGMVASQPEARPFLRLHHKELVVVGALYCALGAAYPLRLVAWAYRQGKKPSRLVPVRIPAAFDPAPLLYPPLVLILVSLLIAPNVEGAVLPNLVLAVCTLPRALIPGARYWECLSCTHWLLSCIPFTLGSFTPTAQALGESRITPEDLTLLYPLHQTLCLVLHHLTTTSLLVSELQLLSASLIGLLLLATSSQAVILKALLWGGGLGLLVSCSQVIQWGITLARVPKWRFRRATPSARSESAYSTIRQLLTLRRPRSWSGASLGSDDSDLDRYPDEHLDGLISKRPGETTRADSLDDVSPVPAPLTGESSQQSPTRRHTLPGTFKGIKSTTTPAGRRKRATSSSLRAFISLTHAQATLRKRLYAAHVYLCTITLILLPIRSYIQHHALAGHEAVGWALAYLFGDVPAFRFRVVAASLEAWIPLPPRAASPASWTDLLLLRQHPTGTTRLLLSLHCLTLLFFGLALLLTRLLSPSACEVDTRRKVFHFMMVGMFLPTALADPCFAGLALSLALAVFLLLDLVRASQLPPLSRPIARFLTPFVDGRDLRGPVVVSHIFLLVGCAVPLWLSLAGLARAEEGEGWEVQGREVGMVAGVVCVGLGDAAASLVGRRWGRSKWLWGGGKSLEGSAAFAAAVFGGLMAAAAWLRLGGWTAVAAGGDGTPGVLDWSWWMTKVPRTAACAAMASLTEAVLTGGNDNVIVPVVLWVCVKSLGV